MPQPARIPTLEKRYAYALGQYEAAARPREMVMGLKALAHEHSRVVARQQKYTAIMEHLATAIRRIDPTWTAGHIKPISATERKRSGGLISRAAFAVVRKAKGPMTAAEIAARVAADLELDTSDRRAMGKLATTIYLTLCKKSLEGVVMRLDTEPYQFELIPLPERRLSASARTLSTRSKPDRRLPPPRASETADRC